MISLNNYITSFIKCTYGKAGRDTICKIENALRDDPKLDFQHTLLSDIKSYNYALAQRGCYSDILWTIYRILNSKSQNEIDQYRKLLPKQTVGVSKLSLDTLCAMFGSIMQELYDSMFERFDYSDCSSLLKDNFSEEELQSAYEYSSYASSRNNFPINEVTKLMPLFISKYIYGIDFSCKKIAAENIDELYSIIINLRKEYIQSENQRIDESNANEELLDKRYFEKYNKHIKYGRTLHIQPDKYYDERELLGVLLDFIKTAELDHNHELCFYIFEQYVLPIFKEIDWESVPFNYIDSKLFFEYFSYIQSVLINKNLILWNDNLALKPNGAELIKDLYRSDTHFKNDGKTIMGTYTRMGLELSKVFYSGAKYLQASFPPDIWNDLLTLIPYIEMCNGDIDEARNFICDTFSQINTQYRIRNYYVTTIIHCILSSTHVKECQQIYNCYVILSLQLQENKPNSVKLYYDMVTFLEEAKNDILERQATTLGTGELWSSLLFADGTFDKKIHEIRHGIELMNDTNVLDYHLYKELINLVAAFSNKSGVHLGMLALAQQDGYDKLPNAVTEEIRRKGERLLKKDKSIKALQRVSNNQYEYQYLDFLSQTHLKELEKKEMSNTLNSITILKNLYSDEELMNNLNTMVDSLSSQLLYDRLRRSFITDKLLQIQNSFYAKYVPAYCKMQLCEGLPINIQQTVINYLVTSETVYEFLSSRKDRAQNDYSAAFGEDH